MRQNSRPQTAEFDLMASDLPATDLLANARMYSVTKPADAAWRTLLAWVSEQTQLPWTVVDHPAPKPLADLWARYDLGCTLMCGLVRTLLLPAAIPIAAPVVAQPRYQ